MEQLLGDNTLRPAILKQLFMQRLPTNIQLILALITQVVEVSPSPAQACAAVPAPALVAAVKPSAASEIELLQALVERLTAQMELLVRQNQYQHGRSRSRSRNQSQHRRDRSSFASGDNPTDSCWYHWKPGQSSCTARSHATTYALPQFQHGPGKPAGQRIGATSSTGTPNQCCLFHVYDKITGSKFLVDTRAEVSILPPTPRDKQRCRSDFVLEAVKTQIHTCIR
ncbi:uncharacterized protein LOC119732325 [Patiria miniata]|uniref:Uncharacterized protein n=1 Tax=Patiria miniata TaxID=46514 RepID=A0A914AD03_PATMI|nr:uncharacterized protein LOC119732325 [Patiria miniata]